MGNIPQEQQQDGDNYNPEGKVQSVVPIPMDEEVPYGISPSYVLSNKQGAEDFRDNAYHFKSLFPESDQNQKKPPQIPQNFPPEIDPKHIDHYEAWKDYNDGSFAEIPVTCTEKNVIEKHLRPRPELVSAATTIQACERGHWGREKFKKNKDNMKEEGDDFIERQKRICEEKGEADVSTYNLQRWKEPEFYPDEGDYFNYNPGRYIFNTALVRNPDTDNVQIYEGQMTIDNRKQGFGTLTNCESVRMGTWRNDQFSGWNVNAKRNGETFEGRITNDDLTGRGLYSNNKKGHSYKGDFVNYSKEGQGLLQTKTTEYDGQFRYNKKNGRGNLKYTSLGHEYDGEFKDDEITGQGEFRWKNGDWYIGGMKNGKMHGKGEYHYKQSGQIYIGNYYEGKKQGEGKIIYDNQKELKATFQGGKVSGYGKYSKNGQDRDVEFVGGKISQSRILGGTGASYVKSVNKNVDEKPKNNDFDDKPMNDDYFAKPMNEDFDNKPMNEDFDNKPMGDDFLNQTPHEH